MCIFVHEDLDFFSISLDKYCKEKDIEVCAVRLKITAIHNHISYLQVTFRQLHQFSKNLDSILNTRYSNKTEFVICGDININYLDNCNKRQQLDTLLQTYNLIGTVSFPTHRSKASTTATDNIFITRTKNYIINPHTNGLSDHEAQIIVTENIVLTKQRSITTERDINDQSILEFHLLLSHENWEEIFMDDTNTSFNKLLNIYLRIFHSCFIKKRKNFNTISKPWKTKPLVIERESYICR